MPAIARLGHVGLYCTDLVAQSDFYTGVLGLTKTDEDLEHGLVFLSARPDEEHHELLLARGRNVGGEARVVQQVSFRCPSLQDVIDFLAVFGERGVRLDMVVSHGNAIAIYFYDPEGNRCEVYWPTGLAARQPYLVGVDLDAGADAVVAAVARSVEQFGATGIVDDAVFATQEIGANP
jgi:catechol 2,3-dioxygenase-like lactoylglutathione lyase family enzyme